MRGIAAAIDFGTTALTTAVVGRERKDAKMKLLSSSRVPLIGMRRGGIVDVDEATRALKRSLYEAAHRAGSAKIRSAVVGLSGAHLSSFATRGVIAVSRPDGEINEEDVRRVLRAAEGLIPKNPNREVIHVIPRGFRVDGEEAVRDPVGMVGMKLEVDALVVDGSRSMLQNILRCLEAAGVDIEDWAVGSYALAEVLLSKFQKELGTVLVNLGGGTTDFLVFEEGRMVDFGTIPIGGSHITSDIAIGLRTNVAIAEAVKLRHARVAGLMSGKGEVIALSDFRPDEEGTVTARELSEIIQARLIDVFELVSKALKRIGRAGLLPGGVVLSGGGAVIPGIRELAKRELELPVEVISQVEHPAFENAIPAGLATAAGLILWQEDRGQVFRSGLKTIFPWSGVAERLQLFLRSLLP